jgi:hypothetical protein
MIWNTLSNVRELPVVWAIIIACQNWANCCSQFVSWSKNYASISPTWLSELILVTLNVGPLVFSDFCFANILSIFQMHLKQFSWPEVPQYTLLQFVLRLIYVVDCSAWKCYLGEFPSYFSWSLSVRIIFYIWFLQRNVLVSILSYIHTHNWYITHYGTIESIILVGIAVGTLWQILLPLLEGGEVQLQSTSVVHMLSVCVFTCVLDSVHIGLFATKSGIEHGKCICELI